MAYYHVYLEKANLTQRKLDSPQEGGGQTRENLQPNSVLIYNRVPKTGSTSLMSIAYELFNNNGMRIVQVRLTGHKHSLSSADVITLSKNISDWTDRNLLLHGHFSYFNPRKFGIPIYPIYINIIRKPLDRLVSYYYFLRYGDDVLDKVRSKAGDTTSFDECVRLNQPDCDPKKLWMQVPFFCGSSIHCWDPGSHWALEQAKANLINNYLVVGVTEDLESFVEVLEFLLPEFFHGAVDYLSETGKSHIKRTKHKDPVSEETKKRMQNSAIYRMEFEFYNFALKHFKVMKKMVKSQKANGGKTQFVFEKVRPK
eukprot:TRINITY_DN11705_c0_g1_i1.p1 TRINITY_DN11705_c0_g1~~TRINITY_DN11705_c0_g1_i1.p1  ORF type:complete len:338 (-),score=22.18 TRINITY_DN11705_c0_g1_i1:527-1462(-)